MVLRLEGTRSPVEGWLCDGCGERGGAVCPPCPLKPVPAIAPAEEACPWAFEGALIVAYCEGMVSRFRQQGGITEPVRYADKPGGSVAAS